MFQKLKGFTRAFWTANIVELLERGAYYGVFIVITLYLSRILGFTDVEAALISGIFSGGLYLLPTFTGALADKIGFKSSLVIAFSLLSIGYFGLGALPTVLESIGLVDYSEGIKFTGLLESSQRWSIVPIMLVIMIGGSFIKSVITGTVAKETTESNRALGFSIFYMMVNIGAFSGKTIVKPLRVSMGDMGLVYLNYFSAAMTFIALIMIIFFYKSSKTEGKGKTLKEIWTALVKVVSNGRLITLILIITGFWMVQHQLYATMPKYVLRMAGEGASPSWYANVNPLIVVLTVTLVTRLMASKTPLFSMTVGMFIMPFSALVMASGNWISGGEIDLGIMSMHPIALMMVLGIVLQGLAESFISPRFLQFFSLQAPKGEEGLYLGFSHLHSFISSVVGFGLSGYLLSKYCPEPKLFETHEAWQAASANAHYIWYYFAGIALFSAISLIVYGKVIERLDAKKQ
ncbi:MULTISPECIES: MFS transporter [Flavobacteriaceae]|uniref:MFS transporter n=2 Tax=Flavobacteriaceae TaxID=49546 RepID=A0A4Y8AT33_9FLAO|nr:MULTISPECIES: MFS transporter [Flavobacteriaceae]TEW75045.1 MFS transporter [Gramella jeungdoensis]GGK42046.1 MFS transporter [Lutibacter litoralis]